MCHSAHGYGASAMRAAAGGFVPLAASLPPLALQARDLNCVLYTYHDEYVIIQIVVNPCHSDIIHETLIIKNLYTYISIPCMK